MSTPLPAEPGKDLNGGLFAEDLQQLILLQRDFAVSAARKAERSPIRLLQRFQFVIAGALALVVAGILLYSALYSAPTPPAPPMSPPPLPAAPVPATPAPVSAQPAKPSEMFSLRVATFRDLTNAERLVKSLESLQLKFRIEKTNDLYAVVAGPFSDRITAESAARAIEQAAGMAPGGIVPVLPPL